MSKKIFYLLTGAALALGTLSAKSDPSTVATVPDGMMSFAIASGATTYLSLPLTNVETYTGAVSTLTTNTISVDDAPAPFTSSLAVAGAPYFVKFLSGNETGRVLLVTANTTSTLTLDTTDHVSGEAVALTTTGFNVQPGDTFEIFPGDTIASIFGDNSANNPLVLTGGTAPLKSDEVSLYTASNVATATYFFNTKTGYWQQTTGRAVSANETIIYPYSAFTVTCRKANPGTTLVVSGRVTQVPAETKIVSRGSVYTSSHYASDVTLANLNLSNWIQGATMATADNLNVWNAALGRFDTYYQKPDSTWRKYPDANTDQSNFTLTAGTVTAIVKRAVVSGAATFLQSSLPYTLQ